MRFVVVVFAFAFAASAAPIAGSGGAAAPAIDWKTLPKQSETDAAAGFSPCAKAPAGMSCIPGGPAIVGDDKEKGSPRRVVEISTFYIDQKEITHAQFAACVAAKACEPLDIPTFNKGIMAPFVGSDQPAMPLDWPRAQAVCIWSGKRLATEWEWEKAARGPNGDLWPWGNDAFACDKAQVRDCAPKGCKPYKGKANEWDCVEHATKPGGSYPAGHYGLFDMAGNGYEWTSTWYLGDTSASGKSACGDRCNGRDPRGPCDGNYPCPKQDAKKVLKGGSWYWPSSQATPFYRRGEVLLTSHHRLSARCASTTTTLTTSPPRALTEKRPVPPIPVAPPAEQVKLATSIKEDVLAKQVCAEKGRSFLDCRDPNHYIKSNEPRQHIWRPYVDNIGGGYVGVGIDQNYSFIAHARSEWAWLFDYDPTVVRLHMVLRAVILDAPDRKAFIAHFQPDAKDNVLTLLGETYKDNPERAAFRELYGVSRASLLSYYEHQADGEVSVPDIVKAPTAAPDAPTRKAGVKVGEQSEDPSFGWLGTEEAYQYIRTLFQQGRIHILKGDMLAKDSMQGIGAAAKAMGVPIRVYYPSNAPECWPWTEQYKKNVLALPMDERSIVIQTLSGIKGGFGKPKGYWHYNVQSGLMQQELLSRRGTGSLKQVVFERSRTDDPDLTTSGLPGGG
jgi:formylglycine-generating enzyme required for sulfatase activity